MLPRGTFATSVPYASAQTTSPTSTYLNPVTSQTPRGLQNQLHRKSSPLAASDDHGDLASSAESNRSVTPTQQPLIDMNTIDMNTRRSAGGIRSDETASDHSKSHRTTPSNASSALTTASTASSSSGKIPSTPSSTRGIFRSKLRKALSLSELNNSSSPSGSTSSRSDAVGRVSLTSNSSSSDTSHSTLEPRTPPNGISPILPSALAASSASNLHSPTALGASISDKNSSAASGPKSNTKYIPPGGSLPSHAGKRFGLLNSKMNSSTDNISISSTVSSASMMLRKMASFGKLGRKSSVRSLSNIFGKSDKASDDGAASTRQHDDAVSEFGVPGAAVSSSKDRSRNSTGNTVSNSPYASAPDAASAGMTPAEALVRSHQEKERKLLEQETARKRALGAQSAIPLPSSGPTSPRSKLLEKEKEKLLKNASGAGKKGRKWSLGAFSRSASSTSLREDAAIGARKHTRENSNSSGSGSRDSTPSPTASATASPIFDVSAPMSANTSATSTTSMSDYLNDDRDKPRPSLDNIQLDAWRHTGSSSLSLVDLRFGDDEQEEIGRPRAASFNGEEDQEEADFDEVENVDDRTPRQSIEILGDAPEASSAQQAYGDWDGEPPNASFFEDDTASFRDGSETEDSRRYFPEPEEYYDDGGHDGRFGQKLPDRPPSHIRPAKGILKSEFCQARRISTPLQADGSLSCAVPLPESRSQSQEALSPPQPQYLRPRASSYDAPVQTMAPNQPGRLAALAQVIPCQDQVDGLSHHPAIAARLDTAEHVLNDLQGQGSVSSALDSAVLAKGSAASRSGIPFEHPSHNVSAPSLVLRDGASTPLAARSMTAGPTMKRNISFAHNLSVHTTWPGSVYDRRGEPATCNRLTPQLAQRIKEELNTYKMEEMEVVSWLLDGEVFGCKDPMTAWTREAHSIPL